MGFFVVPGGQGIDLLQSLLDAPHFLGGTALLAIADEGEPLIKSFGFQVGELLAHVVGYLELEGDCDELMLLGLEGEGVGGEFELVDIEQAEETIFNGVVGFIDYLDELPAIRPELNNFRLDCDRLFIHSVSMKLYNLKNS